MYIHATEFQIRLFIPFYIYPALFVQGVWHKLRPDCSLNQFSGNKTFFVLEARRNDLNGTGRSVYFFRMVWHSVSTT